MTIAIGNDHVGYQLKQIIIPLLESKGYTVKDFGCFTGDEIRQYPIYADRVARAVAGGACEKGILICGTGAGMEIAANKIKGIRAVCCSEPYTAKMATEHNNANILCFGARVVGSEMAKMIVEAYLDARYEERHQVRIDMITEMEETNALHKMIPDDE